MGKSLGSRVHYGHKRLALEDYVATLAFSRKTLQSNTGRANQTGTINIF